MAIDVKDFSFTAVNDGEDLMMERVKKNFLTISCQKCMYYVRRDDSCSAFPKGIPNKFLVGDDYHEKVVEGQEGEWVFKEKP